MNPQKMRLFLACVIASILITSGCTTTRQQNGVTIQKKHSLNPLDYIPHLGN